MEMMTMETVKRRAWQERKGDETDIYDDFINLIRSGFILEQEIRTCLDGCYLEAGETDDMEELVECGMDFRSDTYFTLRDRYDGKVIPTCIKYACYLMEYPRGITSMAEETQEFCIRYDPNGTGGELSSVLEQSARTFEEYVENAEETVGFVVRACNGSAIPATLYRMMQELDQEIMKDYM